MTRLKETLRPVTLIEPADEVWDGYWESAYNRVERGIGWILLSVGTIVLGGYAFWQFLLDVIGDPSMHWMLKGALLALAFGFVVLLVSVLRQRLFARRSDPYREVKR